MSVRSSIKKSKLLLERRHAVISSLLSELFNIRYIPFYKERPIGSILLLELTTERIPISKKDSLILEEALRMDDESLLLISYSIKIIKSNGTEPYLRYEYRHPFLKKNDEDLWVGLPHLHVNGREITTVSNLYRIHFPTYIAPHLCSPFTHKNNFSLQHQNFLFAFIIWVESEFLSKIDNVRGSVNISRHRNLLKNWETFANYDSFTLKRTQERTIMHPEGV